MLTRADLAAPCVRIRCTAMVRTVLLAGLVLALAGGAAPVRATGEEPGPEIVRPASLPPLLGISYRTPGGVLAWFDPLTLRPLPGRKAPLRGHVGSWAFSADHSLLAIASCGGRQAPLPGVRIVNARSMRPVGERRLSRYRGCASALTWLRSDRLLAVVADESGLAREAVVLDPRNLRVIRRASLASWVALAGRSSSELVLLLGNDGEIGPARLAVVDAEGEVRTVVVERVSHGTVLEGEGADHGASTVRPGLAVDLEGRRAFLVPASGSVAAVDLATLRVSYHELDPPSLLGRLWSRLLPDAQAKGVLEGPVRTAVWLGDETLAVTGSDHGVVRAANAEPRGESRPAGLTFVDTRTWSTRRLDADASELALADGLVIAQGGGWTADDTSFGPGLRAFGLDGRERWRLDGGTYRSLTPAGAVGYEYLDQSRALTRVRIVDLRTGTVVRTLRLEGSPEQAVPWLLAGPSAGW